jgi:hypothetical protein
MRRGGLACAAALGVLSSGCAAGPSPVVYSRVGTGGFCSSLHALEGSPAIPSPDEEEVATAVSAAAGGYARRSLELARAIGALGAIDRLSQARARGAAEAEITRLRGDVEEIVSIASLDLASTVAHLECEQGRALKVASALRDAQSEQTQRLTAYSLGVAAAGAIAAGTLDLVNENTTASSIVGIASGAIGGALGFATLAVHPKAPFHHERNALAEVWFGKTHEDFPPSVWAYLTRPELGSDHASDRDALIGLWKRSDDLGDPGGTPTKLAALYFGRGGDYDADQLEARAEMLIEVRDVIDLMNHDLQRLATDVTYR